MTTPTKLARDQFRCFHCRKVFLQRDGDWYTWDSMQVHLCVACERETAGRPERTQKS